MSLTASATSAPLSSAASAPVLRPTRARPKRVTHFEGGTLFLNAQDAEAVDEERQRRRNAAYAVAEARMRALLEIPDPSIARSARAAARRAACPYATADELDNSSAHAGGLSTLVVNGVGEVIGFGAGPWRGAIDEEGGDITGRGGDGSWGDGESSLAYVGAPPFRVPQPPPPPPTAVDEDGDGEAEMDPEWLANGMMTRVHDTRALVQLSMAQQQLALAVPKLLSSLKMPVDTSAQFCAILRNSAQFC